MSLRFTVKTTAKITNLVPSTDSNRLRTRKAEWRPRTDYTPKKSLSDTAVPAAGRISTTIALILLIKILINLPGFELWLMFGAKRAFLSVTPSNDFHTYSPDKFAHFVRSDMSDFFVCCRTFFDDVTDECSNCQRWGFEKHVLKNMFFTYSKNYAVTDGP